MPYDKLHQAHKLGNEEYECKYCETQNRVGYYFAGYVSIEQAHERAVILASGCLQVVRRSENRKPSQKTTHQAVAPGRAAPIWLTNIRMKEGRAEGAQLISGLSGICT